MEPVYLWVEEYKNIKRQGFNFLPKFYCQYDEETKNLDIQPKEHIENFFGKNINITAIVGKNGSGKSSVLNAIVNIIEDDPTTEKRYIIVCSDGETEYYYSNFELNTSILKFDSSSKKLELIIYLDRGDNDNIPIDMGATLLSKPTKYPWVNYSEIDISKRVIVNLLAIEIGKIDSSFKLSTFMYLPNKISIKLKNSEELIGENIRFTLKDRQNIENYFIELTDIEHQLLIIEYLRTNGRSDNILNIITNKGALPPLNHNLIELLKEKEFYINDLTDEDKNIYLRKDGYSHLLSFDLIDEKERRYNDLSHGEKVIFGQLLNLYFYYINRENIIFLLDEPDLSLHPIWQKNYIKELYNTFNSLGKKSHFIITSHSPFILSDLPKENIIFLDTYKRDDKEVTNRTQKEGNCKVLQHDEVLVKKQTFGANIHTLLSDSFFMEDGLMGEFAKNKIQEIMDFFNDEKNIEEISTKEEQIKQVIESIGEPFLKQKLLEMYYKKFKDEASKKARKDELLAEQKRIEAELKNYD